jgi:protein-S-isoprenylcysteine O-methyltransferase Ste14
VKIGIYLYTKTDSMTRDQVGRLSGLFLFSVMLLKQFHEVFKNEFTTMGYVRWFLITVLFILFFVAYIIRGKAKVYANNSMEIFLPLVCAGLPLGIIMIPNILHEYKVSLPNLTFLFDVFSEDYITIGLVFMAVGEVITIVGMMSLKRSFSIFSEVRELVTGGLYRYIRHPLYCGEIFSMIGFLILYPCYWSTITITCFIILQCFRAKIEERKIQSEIPEYKNFKQSTGFLWPSFPGYKKLNTSI